MIQIDDFIRDNIDIALDGYSKEDEPECFAQAYYQKIGTNEHIKSDRLKFLKFQ